MDGTSVSIAAVRDVGPDTIALELETPSEFDAAPGQFVLLRASTDDVEIARHYTISSPTIEDTFEITIGVDPEGELSPWLADRTPGDAVSIDGPFGSVAYERDEAAVAVAGGPGVGPAVAIAEAAIDAGYESTVIYQDDAPAHVDRLDRLESAGASVSVFGTDDESTLQSAIESHLDNGTLYVFGFEDFVESVTAAIENAGGDPDDALIESFG